MCYEIGVLSYVVLWCDNGLIVNVRYACGALYGLYRHFEAADGIILNTKISIHTCISTKIYAYANIQIFFF